MEIEKMEEIRDTYFKEKNRWTFKKWFNKNIKNISMVFLAFMLIFFLVVNANNEKDIDNDIKIEKVLNEKPFEKPIQNEKVLNEKDIDNDIQNEKVLNEKDIQNEKSIQIEKDIQNDIKEINKNLFKIEKQYEMMSDILNEIKQIEIKRNIILLNAQNEKLEKINK